MAAKNKKREVKDIQLNAGKDLCTATLSGTKVEISPEGNVMIYSNESVRLRPAASGGEKTALDYARAKGNADIVRLLKAAGAIGTGFNTVAIYGAKVELAADNGLIVYTNGTVKVKPAPANDTAIKAANDALELGAKMADGSIFAGLTADGRQQIYAMPTDLAVTMTFNDAAKAVKKLNNDKFLGHDDWQIPSLENLRVLYKNQNQGVLKDSFTKEARKDSDSPDWYWSSSENRDDPSLVWVVRFSDGYEGWILKDFLRLSCRPVRLVEASVSVPAPGR